MSDRLAQQTGITTVSDAQLIVAYRDREDATAYSELVRRHQIPVYRLLTGLLTDPDWAEPACEDVFVRAARRLDELPDLHEFEAWVAELARGLAEERDQPSEAGHSRVSLDARLTAAQGRKVMGGAVREVLAGLPPEQRSVLILAELHGEPIERIARTLGISLRIARQRLTAARKQFVAALTEQRRQTQVAASAQPSQALDTADRDTTELEAAGAVAPGYRIHRLLGVGGMGEVFDAEHLDTGRRVALKVLAPERARAAALRQRFEREAAAMRAVRHANLVEPFEDGRTRDGGMFLAMERMEGMELFDLLGAGRLEPRRAIHITRHVLRALQSLHEHEIVHRDVKPENVFVVRQADDHDFAKLFDLGIAKLPPTLVGGATQTRLTGAGMALGTPAYIAPEQALGVEVDGRADLYSTTVMLFEMLAGRLPFDGGDAGAMLAMHVSATPPRLTDIAPSVTGAAHLQPVLDRGLAKRPEHRFESAAALDRALDQVEATLPG